MQLEILTPEYKIYSGLAESVHLPGSEGGFQVLDGHAPLISTLAEGRIDIALTKPFSEDHPAHKALEEGADELHWSLAVKGGVAEVQQDKLIILAD